MKKLLFIALAAVLVVAFCAPAMAADKTLSFYGDYRMNTYWVQKSEEYYNNGLGDTDEDLMWEPDPWDSRFGARFAEGALSANVEIRPVSGSFFRQWWGQYDFGSAQLLIGHTYTPACVAFDMSQFDSESGVVYGDPMSRLRTNMIRLNVPFAMGNFVIAAQNNPLNAPEWAGEGAPANYDTDMNLPELEARLTLNVGPATVDLFGGYATYDAVDTATEDSVSVDSNLWGVKARVPFGPLYVTAVYWGGKNLGNYGDLSTTSLSYTRMRVDTTTGATEDSTVNAYGAVLGYKINDMVTAEVGYLTQKTERYLQEEDDNGTYYLVCAITPVKGLTIYPEIGVRDDKDVTTPSGVTTDQGKRTYFGAYWKISF